MASVGHEGERGERKRILYRDAGGKQKVLRLGECSERAAEQTLAGFGRVLQAHRTGATIHPDGLRWLEALDDRLYARVVRLGLAEPRERAVPATLADLLRRIDATAAVKTTTRITRRQTEGNLRSFFGADRPLASIETADADAWRRALAEPVVRTTRKGKRSTKRLAVATQSRRIIDARAIFARGVRGGLIPSSPFDGLRAGPQSNACRAFYVSSEIIAAVLDACPNAEWRAIVGLARFSGLRCPSEIVALGWSDVNWDRGRLTVRSSKTEGHEGHGVRMVPIAPELRPILQTLFDNAEVGEEAVVPRLRGPGMNLRTGFHRIILRAGLTPWPRLFHNLRASCATDWVERFPNHAVARWLGHSPMIAAMHYLQVRDSHFDAAAGVVASDVVYAATNPATHTRPSDDTDKQPNGLEPRNMAALIGRGTGCDSVETHKSTRK